jgi:hypothetical protein
LLANALGAPLLPEAHSLRDLLAGHAAADANWLKSQAFFGSREALDAQFCAFVGQHLDHLVAIHHRPPTLVLKDPGFLNLLPSLRRLLPGTPVVVSLRDPRDIAASFISIGERQSAAGDTATKYARRDLGHVLRKLALSQAPLLDAAGAPAPLGPRTAVVRYERLTAAPTEELEALARALDIRLGPVVLDALDWPGRTSRHQESWITPLEERPPSSEHVGRFRGLLTQAEIRRVEQHQAAFMAAFGYPLEPEPPPEAPRPDDLAADVEGAQAMEGPPAGEAAGDPAPPGPQRAAAV